MNPIIANFDTKRNLWIVREGRGINYMTDGAFFSYLDEYKNKANGNGSRLSLFPRLRQIWNQMNEIQKVYYRDGEGLVIVDSEGKEWGRHGLIGDGARMGAVAGGDKK